MALSKSPDSKKSLMAATFSKGVKRNRDLEKFLGLKGLVLSPSQSSSVDYVVGWGRKPNTLKARNYARQNNLDYYYLEDGFIHSMGQGVLGAKSCSLIKDKLGVYYDATQVSDLENLILNQNHSGQKSNAMTRSENAMKRMIKSSITKYNNGSFSLANVPFSKGNTVLVIDQTAGDMSLKYGYVDQSTCENMLQAAIRENPDAQVILKTHPDVIAGKKQGSIDLANLSSRVEILADNINPIVLLKKVDVVYVATSQMGFEALMLGKKVICFGVPFYAGWGLTDDRADKSLSVWGRRNSKKTIGEVFEAAYIEYPLYMHPDTKKICTLEHVLSYFELQLSKRLQVNSKLFCINFTRWKKNYIKSFLKTDTELVFVTSAEQANQKGFDSNSQLVTWASKNQSEVKLLAEKYNVKPWHVEDGFIRSAGLGTDLTAPASLVLDKTGIYYDPHTPSDLEGRLQNKVYSEQELTRANQLKKSLLENELSKYNLGSPFDKDVISAKPNQTVILIPGQVEDDASIKKGCVDVSSNGDLIKAVREKEPDAYLIFKPHPDVVSGNRKGKVDQNILEEYADLVLLDASITDCLAVVDEVHTMTSLVGFEGLLRELKVVCYGLPFYSNWGLTEDRHNISRRTRKLELDELVAATLIDYPLYINWQTGDFTTPEVIVQQLKEKIDQQGGKLSNQVFWPYRQIRKLKNIVSGVFFTGARK